MSLRTLLNVKKHYYRIMKRFLILLLIIFAGFSCIPCAAEDGADFWDEPMKIDAAAKSQERAVTNQEFEKVIKMFEKKKDKQKEKSKPKGKANTQLAPDMPENANSEMGVFKNTYEAYPTVMIPVTLTTPYGAEITPGYYRILSVKKDYGFFLNFYQGNSLVAKIQAVETGNDHNQKSLNYAKIIPVDNKYMNVIYGDIDCNIEAKLDIKN